MTAEAPPVAIVHDYLNQRGGAERVVLELARTWPEAPVYASLYRPGSTFPAFAELPVRTSWLNRLPVDAGFRRLFPLYPSAFRSLGTLPHDIVISSSSGWAHGVRTGGTSTHVVYCYTPARWLYRADTYRPERRLERMLARPMLRAMRRWDITAAQRADRYVAISQVVRRRIRDVYGIDAAVVYPPVDVDRFEARPRGNRVLVVSRLLPYKRIDLAIRAANRTRLPLDIVGVGPSLRELREMSGPTVVFHGRLDDQDVVALMQECRALVLPGEEDFGITPIEANAAGKPVIAYAGGGALETMQEGTTAAFFRDRSPEAVLEAIKRADGFDSAPSELAQRARDFSPEVFRARIRSAVEGAVAANAAGDRATTSR